MPSAKPVAPFKEALETVLPAGGPAFQTGALGGPEGLSEGAMRVYTALRALAEGMQSDPMGGLQPLGMAAPAALVGPAKSIWRDLLPQRLSRYLESRPEAIYTDVSHGPMDRLAGVSGRRGTFLAEPEWAAMPSTAHLDTALRADPSIHSAVMADIGLPSAGPPVPEIGAI